MIRALALCLLFAATLAAAAQEATPEQWGQGAALPTDAAHQAAYNAQLADLGSTAGALALGATGLNPLGAFAIPLKFIALSWADGLPTGERETAMHAINGISWGAASSNLCVVAAILTGGVFAPACFALGVAVGYGQWQSGAMEREFWYICAAEKKSNPRLTCVFTNPEKTLHAESTQ